MKKDKSTINNPDKLEELQKDLPVKNAVTNSVENSAKYTPGLNQEKTKRDDLFPSDGDNLTN